MPGTVVVTGGNGMIGREVRRALRASGYDTVSVDLWPAADGDAPSYRRADLMHLWKALEAVEGAGAVVHLAAVGVPERSCRHPTFAQQHTFAHNVVTTYNVFAAAVEMGVRRVVWASSETTLGPPFEQRPPDYLPIDDDHPVRPETTYALSKAHGEEMARYFHRTGCTTFVGLRLSVVRDPAEYRQLDRYRADPLQGRWNAWGYVDIRDAASAFRLAVERPVASAEVFLVAAGDTLANRPNSELAARWFPGVPLRAGTGESASLLSTRRAREVLGYQPVHSWRGTEPGRAARATDNDAGVTGPGRC